MKITPQAMTVLRHLNATGSITPTEAATVHKVRHLPARIHELRNAGVEIAAEIRHDVTKQRYTHYSINQEV